MHPTRSRLHRAGAAAAAAALTAALAACSGADSATDSASTDTVSVTDGTGTELQVPAHAERIVCLTAICDDALTELGLRPAASTNAGEHGLLALPEFLGSDAMDVPVVEGAFGEENLEQVVAAEPQLVIGLEGAHDGLREPLADAAPTYLARIASVEDSQAFLREMGRITGRESQAEQAITKLDRTLEDAAAQTKDSGARTLAMFGTDKNFGVDTEDSVLGSVLSRLGEYPWPTPAGQQGGHSAGQGTYSLEEIARKDPNVIFVQTFSFGPDSGPTVSEQLAADPVWSQLSAVKNKHVVEVPTAIWAEGRGTRSLGLVAEQAATEIAKATS